VRMLRPSIGWRRASDAGRAGFDEFSIIRIPIRRKPRFEASSGRSASRAAASGDRVEFISWTEGRHLPRRIAYTFLSGSRLVYQEAVVSTQQPETAYLYDTGLQLAARERPPDLEGGSGFSITYYNTDGQLQTVMTSGPDAGRPPFGIAPSCEARCAASRYFLRLNTTSRHAITPPYGYVWFHGWAGVRLRTLQEPWQSYRHPTDDGAGAILSWINAPPGTSSVWALLPHLNGSPETPWRTLSGSLAGIASRASRYKTLTSHWHWGYTMQALAKPRIGFRLQASPPDMELTAR